MPADPNTIVVMTVADSNGNIVAALKVTAGNAASTDVFLGAGTYTVTTTASTTSGTLQSIDFELDAIGTTEQVGTKTSNPSGTTTTTSPTKPTGASTTYTTTAPSSTAKWN